MGSIPVELPESVFYRNQGNQFLAQQDAISTRYNVASSKNIINGAIGIGTAVAGIGAQNPAMVMRGVSSIIDSGMSQYSASAEKNIQNQMFEAKLKICQIWQVRLILCQIMVLHLFCFRTLS